MVNDATYFISWTRIHYISWAERVFTIFHEQNACYPSFLCLSYMESWSSVSTSSSSSSRNCQYVWGYGDVGDYGDCGDYGDSSDRSKVRGGHYCNLTIDSRVTHYRSQYMYSGIYGPRSVFSVCCPPLPKVHSLLPPSLHHAPLCSPLAPSMTS